MCFEKLCFFWLTIFIIQTLARRRNLISLIFIQSFWRLFAIILRQPNASNFAVVVVFFFCELDEAATKK